jgi:Ca-activated chloride channel family protein
MNIVENQFVDARKYPVTGMSLNIDRASYSNIRRFINYSSIVPYDAVRIEEMLNYFNFSYDKPDDNDIFKIKTTVTSCPWEKEHQLFFVNLSSQKINLDLLPPSNFVFLIDVSGSMDMPNRLPLLQSAFKLLVNNLRDKDTVSIVAYGGEMGAKLDATSGAEKEKILKAIDELTPGGSTPGESGLRLAYNIAHLHFNKGGNNRIILATDGDFNVGAKKEEDLAKLVSMHRQSGIYLTCLGVGMGNYKDSKIQVLSEKGNGNFAYLDNYQEAEKVLLKEFTQTLYAVADNVYMNVEFNPEYVKEYRLIGFDNKAGALKDTASVLEGGEIGSGYSMIAAFEVTPSEINKGAIKDGFMGGKFADINLQYRYPKDTANRHFSFNSTFNFIPIEKADRSYRFAASVIMFGSTLRSSSFTKKINWENIITLASNSADMDNATEKEFIGIVKKAKTLYIKNKKKRGIFNFWKRE